MPPKQGRQQDILALPALCGDRTERKLITMYTRWRLYILAVFAVVIAALVIGCHFWRRRGHAFGAFREVLLILGVVLIVETLIISTLSNFNLGVILPTFFGVPLVFWRWSCRRWIRASCCFSSGSSPRVTRLPSSFSSSAGS